MSDQLHDDTFTPFTITDGCCVVAPQSEWARIERAAIKGTRIAVGDVFAEWDGPVLFPDGHHVRKTFDGSWRIGGITRDDFPVKAADIRRRLFSMIDRTPATWCIETRFPESVLIMIPDGYWQKLPCPKHSKRFELECPACNGKNAERVDKPRPNLHLYAGPLYTQADADRMVPALLRCPAVVRGLTVTPREEIDLSEWMYTIDVQHNGDGDTREVPCKPPVNHITIRGDDKPMHPEHVRGIVRQCEAAGVPVWFDGHGEWVHESHLPAMSFDERMKLDRQASVPFSNMMARGDIYYRVGRTASGSMLDGKTWRQLPEVRT
jgi:hypothetical protein